MFTTTQLQQWNLCLRLAPEMSRAVIRLHLSPPVQRAGLRLHFVSGLSAARKMRRIIRFESYQETMYAMETRPTDACTSRALATLPLNLSLKGEKDLCITQNIRPRS